MREKKKRKERKYFDKKSFANCEGMKKEEVLKKRIKITKLINLYFHGGVYKNSYFLS